MATGIVPKQKVANYDKLIVFEIICIIVFMLMVCSTAMGGLYFDWQRSQTNIRLRLGECFVYGRWVDCPNVSLNYSELGKYLNISDA